MLIVINEPSAADDLVGFLSGHGCPATKRTAFVVEIESSASEADVERHLLTWRSTRGEVGTELMTPRPRHR